MAEATRSRKRGAQLNRRDDDDDNSGDDFNKRIKQNSLRDEDFLGFCQLEEIDYYKALKINNDEKILAKQNEIEFALLVARKANVVVNQVRKYNNLEEIHHKNVVHDVLILIQHARSVLMNNVKRQQYDNIVNNKNEYVSKICDVFIYQLDQVNNDLKAALILLKTDLDTIKVNFPHSITVALAEVMENWLAAQPIVIQRPTSMNRVFVTWTPFPNEQNFTKEQTKQLIFDTFKNYGEIVNVYVCDVDINMAVVEYKTQQAQQRAIEQNKSPKIRFTVTEYIFKNFYTAQFRAKLRDDINKIDKDIKDMQKNIINLQTRYGI